MTRQIGVMGSAADLGYDNTVLKMAERTGELIAENGFVLFFGAEKDGDSLSTAACRGAKRKGGMTIGVTYNKGKDIYQKGADAVISTGLERGGGRELVLVLSCDAIIAIGGGSGTLTEIAIAYQAGIPVVVIEGTGGWADKLANTYLDGRKRSLIYGAKDAEQALELVKKLLTTH